jgi:hypothetical protein
MDAVFADKDIEAGVSNAIRYADNQWNEPSSPACIITRPATSTRRCRAV